MTGRRMAGVAAGVAGLAFAAYGTAQVLPKPEPLMRQKLAQSQKAIEAVATADFDLLQRTGEELIALGKRAEWQVYKTPEYERQLEEFRRNARALAQAGKEKNGDAAALAYVQLSMNCFNCHKHVREQRMALLK